jgi:uncharacterized membrane protein YbhN (UPF0104 family)
MTKHPIIQAIGGLGFGGLCLWIAFSQTDMAALADAVAVIEPRWIVAAMAYYVLNLAIRVTRWRLLLQSVRPLEYGQVGAALITGYAVNNLLPARLGELFRADFVRRHFRVRRSAVLGTILVERLLDGLMLILILNLGLLLTARGAEGRELLIGLSVIATTGVAVVLAGTWNLARLRERLLGFGWPWMQSRLDTFAETVALIRDHGLARPAALTLPIYLIEALTIDAALRSAGVEVGPGAVLVVLGAASLSTLLPTAPGYVGSYQLAFILSLGLFAYDAPRAIVAATVVQAFLLGGVVVAGLATLFYVNLKELAADHGNDD